MAEDEMRTLLHKLDANAPATDEVLTAAEESHGSAFPAHYRAFLRLANGCEGSLGLGYAALWNAEELAERNAAYAVDEFAPGLLLIGSDGGDTAYALDGRHEGCPVVTVPFMPMALGLVERVGDTVLDLLLTIEAGQA